MVTNNCQWRVQEQGKAALCLKTMAACIECKAIEISVEAPLLVNCYTATFGLNGHKCHDCGCCHDKEPDRYKMWLNRLEYLQNLLANCKKVKYNGDPLKVIAQRKENSERIVMIKGKINSLRTVLNYHTKKKFIDKNKKEAVCSQES